jgi:hypothetical protein
MARSPRNGTGSEIICLFTYSCYIIGDAAGIAILSA